MYDILLLLGLVMFDYVRDSEWVRCSIPAESVNISYGWSCVQAATINDNV